MTTHRSMRAARAFSFGLLAPAVAAAALLVAPVAGAEPSPAADEIPIHGQAQVLGVVDEGTPLVLSVHGVQRTPDATLLYYSLAYPPKADIANSHTALSAIGPAAHVFLQSMGGSSVCDVAVIDQRAAKLYVPLSENTLCARGAYPEAGEARVTVVAVAPVPADATVVDVSIHGTIITDIPVGDGELAPVAEESTPLLGTGWPALDLTKVPADTDKFVLDLRQAVSDLEGEITETATAIEIAGDVLFEKHSFDIDAAGRQVVAQAAEQLTDKDITGTLRVIGHTDSDGETGYNQTLSENRAKSVADALRTSLGADVTIESEGRGESEPIASNNSSEGKALNRRVTIEFVDGSDS